MKKSHQPIEFFHFLDDVRVVGALLDAQVLDVVQALNLAPHEVQGGVLGGQEIQGALGD